MSGVDEVERVAAETGFSASSASIAEARRSSPLRAGLADRRWGIPNELATRFGIASGTKGLTALTVVSLIESGELALETTADRCSAATCR